MSSLLVYGLLALAVIGSVAGLYAKVHHDGYVQGEAEIQQRWDSANKLSREHELKQGTSAAQGLEADRATEKIVYRTITQQVGKIVDRPVYRNVCLDADGLRLARCAIRGEGADSCKPDPALPAPVRPSGRNGGIHLALDRGELGSIPGLRGEAQAAD